MPSRVVARTVIVDDDMMQEPWVPDVQMVGGVEYIKVEVSNGLKRLCGCKVATKGLSGAPFLSRLRAHRNLACEDEALSLKGRAADPFAQDSETRKKIWMSVNEHEAPLTVFVTLCGHPRGGMTAAFVTNSRAAVVVELTEVNIAFIQASLIHDLDAGFDRAKREIKDVYDSGIADCADNTCRLKFDEARFAYYWYGTDNDGKRHKRFFAVDKSDDPAQQSRLHDDARTAAMGEWAVANVTADA